MRKNVEEPIPESLWEWCPYLQFIEISTPNICAMWPPPARHHGLAIILMDLKANPRWDGPFEEYTMRLYDIITSRKVKLEGHSFAMPISWSSLQQRLEYCRHSRTWGKVSSPLLRLFTCLQAYGYTLTDRHGVGLESTEAQAFIKWLGARIGGDGLY
jgi:hypothetical protein